MAHYRKATLGDCVKLAPNLREADQKELLLSSGEEPLEALIASLQASEECNAILNDEDEVVGIFGVAPVDEHLGSPWLLGSEGIKDIAKEFIEGSHDWVEQVQSKYRVLVNYVHKDNEIAIKWLRKLDFQFIKLVEEFGVGKAPFYEFVRIQGQ